VPAYRLDVFERDSFVRSFDVAVGMRKYPTPRGSFALRTIEWNPWWIPPKSEWAMTEKTTPPGRDNPMGRVKLYMQQLYFLHGTPLEGSIGSAASHGCVRLRNRDAIELARLVHRYGTPSVSEATVDSARHDLVNTRRYTVELPVPITVRYDRVELRGRRLVVYPDIYRIGPTLTAGDLLATLESAGVDVNDIDDGRLMLLLRRAQQGRASIPIDSLSSNGRR
jgi:murein L,D-transpeptidase YcbB/YkuD